MEVQRKTDLAAVARFRTDRFFKYQEQWYFMTREGAEEGPFESEADAHERSEKYLLVMQSALLPVENSLSLLPIEAEPSSL